MSTITANERPSIRFYHKDDGGCSWKSIGTTLCGSCGCVYDTDDDDDGGSDDNSSGRSSSSASSTSEFQNRKMEVTKFLGGGAPMNISSLMLIDGARATESFDNENNSCCAKCCRCCCRRHKKLHSDSIVINQLDPLTKRVIKINDLQDTRFASNVTTTAKYTIWSFLPIFLYEQFRRYSNLFFLLTALLQQIPGVSPTGRYATILPLLFIFAVSAVKELVEDWQRHRADWEANNRKVEVLRFRVWQLIRWAEVHVGDIVRVHDGHYFPADMILLSSSTPNGMCFVQTISLDGEANLKVKQAVTETADIDSAKKLSKLRGYIECEPPNRRIYDFIGVLLLEGQETPIALGPNQVLNRGAALSNTPFINGIVVYAGHDTKLMKNFARAPLKNSSVDRLMNKQIITLFILFLIIVLTSAVMHLLWNYANYARHSYLAIDHAIDKIDIFYTFVTFFILLNNLIPISLQVSLEMVRFFQAKFINSDREMYHEETDTPACARTSNLNEELGTVKYVLTDKTGTLTCNVMKFKKCSIAGIIYDVINMDEEGKLNEAEFLKNIRQGHPTATFIEEFLLAITLTHSVIAEIKADDSVVYHATNPDDQAIIEGAQLNGYEFLMRTGKYLHIRRLGQLERYELLDTIEFSSNRKRMSVIVRMPAGNIKLYCKGADSIIYERLADTNDPYYYDTTLDHLNNLSALGYRTLVVAVSELTEEQYETWSARYHVALTSLNEREKNVENAANLIETNLTLLGVTAIEDKLQDGVPETIAALLKADIKVWMLTGDKQETAINIGFSSGLLTKKFRLVIINEESLRGTYLALRYYRGNLKSLRNVALVIDGKTLQFAMSSKLRPHFRKVCFKCRVVVCCRLSPIQKGEIAELVNSTGACSLAIGDGANDVAMIRKARVGVGISGAEGRQAACASDYSIAQFRYLHRLLFVHGTWNYRRITTTVLYAFYKNIAMCIIQLWYCIHNGWSSQVLFDVWAISGYNVIFSAMPPMVLGIFDKVCNEEALLRYPRIYRRAHDAKLFNVGIFWVWITNAFLHSIVLFSLTIWIFSASDTIWTAAFNFDRLVLGHTIYTAVITTVTLKAGLTMHSWNWVTHVAVWGSIALWFTFLVCFSYIYPLLPVGAEFVGLHLKLFGSPFFWLIVILSSALTLLPDFFFKVFYHTYFTTITEVARQGDKKYGRQVEGRLTRISRKLKRATLMGYI